MYYRGKGVWYFSKQLHQGDSCWRPTRLPQHTCMVSAQYTKSPTPRLPLMTFVCQATCIHSYGHLRTCWSLVSLVHGSLVLWIPLAWMQHAICLCMPVKEEGFAFLNPFGSQSVPWLSSIGCWNKECETWVMVNLINLPCFEKPIFNCVDRQRHHFQRVWWCSVRLRTIS